MREISEAKLAMMMRPLALRKTSSKAGSITRSEGVQPARSALVESASSASTPRSENSASLAIIGRPAVDRGVVELVIAGMDHQPGRRVDAQPDAVGDRVADVEELDLERADLDRSRRPGRCSSCALLSSPPRASLTSSRPRVSGVA